MSVLRPIGEIGGIIAGLIVIWGGLDMLHASLMPGLAKAFIGLGIFCVMLICAIGFRDLKGDETDDKEQ